MKKMLQTVTVVLLLMLCMQNGYAQHAAKQYHFDERALYNLTQGITSQNEGLRRSSIYLAGKYQIAEMVPVLCRQFQRETDSFNKRLILLSIYQTGEFAALSTTCLLAQKDSSHSVKHLSAALLLEIQRATLASE